MSARWDGLWFALAVLALWQGLHYLVGASGLSSPAETLGRTVAMMVSLGFWRNAAATGEAFALAALITIVGGLACGLVLGLSRIAGEVAEPILAVLYALPKITLYPVILLFFGLGLPAKVAFGVAHGLFPVMILTMSGVRAIQPVIRKTARAMRLSSFATMRTVLLPAAMPEIFTGLRIGIVLSMFGALIGELFASDRGLGFLLMRVMERGDVAGTLALAVLLFAFAILSGIGLLALDRRLNHGRS